MKLFRFAKSLAVQHSPYGYIDDKIYDRSQNIDIWFLLNKNNAFILNSLIHGSSYNDDVYRIVFLAHHLYDETIYRILSRHSNILLISLGKNLMDGVNYLSTLKKHCKAHLHIYSPHFFQFSKASRVFFDGLIDKSNFCLIDDGFTFLHSNLVSQHFLNSGLFRYFYTTHSQALYKHDSQNYMFISPHYVESLPTNNNSLPEKPVLFIIESFGLTSKCIIHLFEKKSSLNEIVIYSHPVKMKRLNHKLNALRLNFCPFSSILDIYNQILRYPTSLVIVGSTSVYLQLIALLDSRYHQNLIYCVDTLIMPPIRLSEDLALLENNSNTNVELTY